MISVARERFLEAFQSRPAFFEVFTPGRVNLLGEHTDYNGGRVLPFAIRLGACLSVRLASRQDFAGFAEGQTGSFFVMGSDVFSDVFVVGENDVRDHLLRRGMLANSNDDRELMLPEMRASWAKYALGSLVVFFEQTKGRLQFPEDAVVAIWLTSNLPVGSGLSSSAALCTGLISALCFAFGKHFSAQDISKMAMQVEHRFSGTKCGLMDQLAVMCSQAGHFTSIDFAEFPSSQKAVVKHVCAHRNFCDYTAVAFHTGVSHSLADSEYNQRRVSCEKALMLLNTCGGLSCLSLGEYSCPTNFKSVFRVARENAQQPDLVKVMTELFQEQGLGADEGAMLARRAAHAIFENVRVDKAMWALVHGDLEMIDIVMQESHQSLRFDYEVSCDELDYACDIARSAAHKLARAILLKEHPILGPRMTGGGFGGSTVQLVHNGILEKFVQMFNDGMNPYSRKTGCQPKLIVSQPQNGLRISIV